MKRNPFRVDERSRGIAFQVMSFMYLFTILFMMGILIYRQFILMQPVEQYEELAMLFTVNVIFIISGFLYYGILPINRLSISKILAGYLAFIILGFLSTYIKYTFLVEFPLSFGKILDKLFIIIVICGLFVLFFTLFAYLGKKKLEKELT